MTAERIARRPRPSGWMAGQDYKRISWSFKGMDEKLCGYRESGGAGPCGASALYKFTMKRWKNEPDFQPRGLTCAEHALVLRGWPTLEKMETL